MIARDLRERRVIQRLQGADIPSHGRHAVAIPPAQPPPATSMDLLGKPGGPRELTAGAQRAQDDVRRSARNQVSARLSTSARSHRRKWPAPGSLATRVSGSQAWQGSSGLAVAGWTSTRLNSSHSQISYAVFCLKKKKNKKHNF